MAPYKLSYY